MNTYIYKCTCISIYIYIHIYVYIHIHIYIYTYVYTYIHTDIFISIICMYAYMDIYLWRALYVCLYVYIQLYVHVCTCCGLDNIRDRNGSKHLQVWVCTCVWKRACARFRERTLHFYRSTLQRENSLFPSFYKFYVKTIEITRGDCVLACTRILRIVSERVSKFEFVHMWMCIFMCECTREGM